jgi:Protein of unknown function (DUF3575)
MIKQFSLLIVFSITSIFSFNSYSQVPVSGTPVTSLKPSPAVNSTSSVPKSEPIAETVDNSKFSITMSPVHLILPVGELTVEYKVAEKIGIAFIAGIGTVTVEDVYQNEEKFNIWEIGGQFKYYLTGNFRKGLHVGVETIYMKVSYAEDSTVDAEGDGLTIGGFVGYKHTFGFGLTLEAQLGGQQIVVTAKSANSEESDSKFGVLFNLNIGYTF